MDGNGILYVKRKKLRDKYAMISFIHETKNVYLIEVESRIALLLAWVSRRNKGRGKSDQWVLSYNYIGIKSFDVLLHSKSYYR
jgi:hypothetical protein